MNRPRIVGILSAVIGSTAGFLVLSRWRLAGTVTGAVVVPVIYTIVSHCCHESLTRVGGWMRCRVGRGADPAPAEPEAAAARPADETAVSEKMRPAGHRLQWSVVTLALLAFGLSVYSLAQSEPGIAIMREKVVQTVTVTTEQAKLSVAHRSTPKASPVAKPPTSQSASTTTTANSGQGVLPTTTVSTVAKPGDGSDLSGNPPTTTTLR